MKYPVVVMALIALPLPTLAQTNSALITNGRALFNDTRLSGSGQYSCASCHPNGHTDNMTYVGRQIVADGDPAGRNTPSLWGAGTAKPAGRGRAICRRSETSIRDMIVNRMKGAEPPKQTLDALAAYTRRCLMDLRPFSTTTASRTTPRRPPSSAATHCSRQGRLHRIAMNPRHTTARGSRGPGCRKRRQFNAPSLRSVGKTAPYFHD